MKILKTSLFSICLMISSIAGAQNYEDFDTDRNDRIDRNEFTNAYSQNFDAWDTDRDKNISEKEFHEGTYSSLDVNGDNNISSEEWNDGYDFMYGEQMQYSSYDFNRDRRVDRKEFLNAVYDKMDRNRDEGIDLVEFNDSSSFYVDGSQKNSDNIGNDRYNR